MIAGADIVRAFSCCTIIAGAVFAFATLTLGGCALQQAENHRNTVLPAPTSSVAGPLTTPQARATFHILVGTMAAHRGQSQTAVKQLLEANKAVADKKLVTQAAALALATDHSTTALKAVQALAKQEPDEPRVYGTLLHLAVNNDRPETAFNAGQKLLKLSPDKLAKVYRAIAGILSEARTLKQEATAAKVMKRLVALHPELADAHYAAGLLALRQYNPDTSLAQARQAMKLKPHDRSVTFMVAAAYIQMGQLQKAKQTVQPLFDNADDADQSIALRMGYAQILFKYGRYNATRKLLQDISKHNPDIPEVQLMLVRCDLLLNHPEAAARALDKVSHGTPKRESEIWFYHGRIAEALHDNTQALKYYDKAAGTNFAVPAGIRIAVIKGRQGKLKQAREDLSKLALTHPDHAPACVAAESALLLHAGKKKQALAVIKAALSRDPGDTELIYQSALVSARNGQLAQAESALHQLITNHPHDARYLNGLGFMLIEDGTAKDLPEAQRLISKALQLAPEDPSILDSMGWVLFRRGNTKKALPYLQQAYTLLDNPEIAAHLVTVLAANGEHAAAENTLKKALAHDPENAALKRAAQHLNP